MDEALAGPELGERVVLRMDGVESYAEVRLNGALVGWTKGSRLSAELDLTAHVRAGDNLLSVTVLQFSDGTYLEDQDMWWASGIFRDFYLTTRPDAGLFDLALRTPYLGDGHRLEGELVLGDPASSVDWSLRTDGRVVAEGSVQPDSTGRAQLRTEPLKVAPWTPETPALHELLLTVRGAGGAERWSRSCRTGSGSAR